MLKNTLKRTFQRKWPPKPAMFHYTKCCFCSWAPEMRFHLKLWGFRKWHNSSDFRKFHVLVIFLENRIFSLKTRFATLCGFSGAVCWPSVTDTQTSRKRGRVQPRAGGREAETYPAFGGAPAHPPELQYFSNTAKGI